MDFDNIPTPISGLTFCAGSLTDLPIYHTTDFNHSKMSIYSDRSPWVSVVSTWGLVG
ncbi:MAG: hypothetical protein JJE44_12295 [Flavobacteriaceae bacterium]|nr:hypothetical protein [Flavobacteriaceae bacterium]